MSYTRLPNQPPKFVKDYNAKDLTSSALRFIREACEDFKFDNDESKMGNSIGKNQIPYNMQMDNDRLCLENALNRFLASGSARDAFDVYFCFIEIFFGTYNRMRYMIEMLSEYESNGSSLLMKHRDHYSHSVYVFALGLAIYESNAQFRKKYADYYELDNEHTAAHHFLEFWGLTSLFHDIGYPFELPYEQVVSYFLEKEERKSAYVDERSQRANNPYIAYRNISVYTDLNEDEKCDIDFEAEDTNDVFSYWIDKTLGNIYSAANKENMKKVLVDRPTSPCSYMDHAYFSATVLFKHIFTHHIKSPDNDEQTAKAIKKKVSYYLDSMTAILLHNSLFKHAIRKGDDKSKVMKPEYFPLAYMLMLCDELQCWDRTSYGRNSRTQLHPLGCDFVFDSNIKATYIFDDNENKKIEAFENGELSQLKSYSSFCSKDGEECVFANDIEEIVDLTEIKLTVDIKRQKANFASKSAYLSSSSFMHLYNFAAVLNAKYNGEIIDEFKDHNQKINKIMTDFDSLSLEYKLSNIGQAKAFVKYLDMLNCFYTDKPVNYELVNEFTQEELDKIGPHEHFRWLYDHHNMGWKYGEPQNKIEREQKKIHQDMIPGFEGEIITYEIAHKNYIRLNPDEKAKDYVPMQTMLKLIKLFDGLRVYRLG